MRDIKTSRFIWSCFTGACIRRATAWLYVIYTDTSTCAFEGWMRPKYQYKCILFAFFWRYVCFLLCALLHVFDGETHGWMLSWSTLPWDSICGSNENEAACHVRNTGKLPCTGLQRKTKYFEIFQYLWMKYLCVSYGSMNQYRRIISSHTKVILAKKMHYVLFLIEQKNVVMLQVINTLWWVLLL